MQGTTSSVVGAHGPFSSSCCLLLGPIRSTLPFLREQGFEDFLQIPPFTMRHGIAESLVQWFHTEIGTFHLSCREYAVLPLDWIVILGIRFGGHQISTREMSFDMACKLLGIPSPLIAKTRGYFGPIALPQICTEWLQSSIPWDVAPTDALHQFFLWFLGSCFLVNNWPMLTF